MAKRDFLVNIDLNKNEILNVKIQNLATAPVLSVNDKGYTYFDTTLNLLRTWDGSGWVSGGDTSIADNSIANSKLAQVATATIKGRVTAGTGNVEDLTAAQVRTILNVENGAQANVATNLSKSLSATEVTINSSTGSGVAIGAADSTNAGVMTKAMYDKLTAIEAGADITDSVNVANAGAVMKTDYDANTILVANSDNTPVAVVLNTNSVLGRIAGNIQAITIDSDLSTVSASDDSIASAKAIKAYIDSSTTGALVYQGGYNASTNTPALTSSKKGSTYTVTAAGTFFSTPVQVGDMIIAEIDNPSVEADFTIVNKNIADIVDANEGAKGIIQLATAAEVTAATDTAKAITPANLGSITKLGTIGTGTWQGTIIGSQYGGTGVNNAGRTLTINTNSGTLAFTNASTTLTIAANASVSGTNTGDQTTISGNAGTATKLQTARNISLSGDISGSVSFDGSADAAITATLPNIATAGTYKSVTVNAKGQVTAGTNPTTLSGYGITDAVKKYATDITGTGSATSFTVTHNLGSTDIVTFVKDASTLTKVEVEEVVTNTNVLTLNFNVAPTNGKIYRVVVMA